jgi:hypothetical protein
MSMLVLARYAAEKDVLTHEYKLYRLEFAESSVDRPCDSNFLTNLHLGQQMMGQFQFADHRESGTTPRMCRPPYAVVVISSLLDLDLP